jgi:hypothetical protein
VTIEEMKGAAVSLDGRIFETERLVRIRDLTAKYGNNTASDRKLMELFILTSTLPGNIDVMNNPKVNVYVNGKLSTLPPMDKVFREMDVVFRKQGTAADMKLVRSCLKIVRSIFTANNELRISENPPPDKFSDPPQPFRAR